MNYIYVHKNKVNGKCYIGQTKNGEKRWRLKKYSYIGSPKFYNALIKYGWSEFESSILVKTKSDEEANKIEQRLIAQYNSINNGYNLSSGGKKHFKHTQETKDKISQALLKRYSGDWKPSKRMMDVLKNRVITEEHKRIISLTHKGKHVSKDTKLKISIANKGRKLSDERKAQVSLQFKNTKLSDERKKAISISKRNKTYMVILYDTVNNVDYVYKSLVDLYEEIKNIPFSTLYSALRLNSLLRGRYYVEYV